MAETTAKKTTTAKKAPAKKTAAAPRKHAPADPKRTRATKSTRARAEAANREAEGQADAMDQPDDDRVLPEERGEWFNSPGFRRMKTEWSGEDKAQLDRVQGVIDRRIFDLFKPAYALMSDLYDIVREPEADTATGEIKKDPYGFVIWARDPITGLYIEDWSRLTITQRENFLFRIAGSLYEWELAAVDMWTEAMFAKGIFTERFAIEYDRPMTGTIDDRNAVGNVKAAEERYFALMMTACSRKADAIVRTLTNLQLRLKDTLGG